MESVSNEVVQPSGWKGGRRRGTEGERSGEGARARRGERPRGAKEGGRVRVGEREREGGRREAE